MVNPSTADGETDDPTIRRVIGFAQKFGWALVIVGNVFAFRATEVRALRTAKDPCGPHNATHLKQIFEEAELAVFAWGPLAKLPLNLRDSWRFVWSLAAETKVPVRCLGTALDGHPRHPLMLKKAAELMDWSPPPAG